MFLCQFILTMHFPYTLEETNWDERKLPEDDFVSNP